MQSAQVTRRSFPAVHVTLRWVNDVLTDGTYSVMAPNPFAIAARATATSAPGVPDLCAVPVSTPINPCHPRMPLIPKASPTSASR